MYLRIKLPTWFSSKNAVLKMRNLPSFSWWFQLENNSVLAIDCLPENSPEMEVALFPTVEDAIKRKREMAANEGWEIIEDYLEDAKGGN